MPVLLQHPIPITVTAMPNAHGHPPILHTSKGLHALQVHFLPYSGCSSGYADDSTKQCVTGAVVIMIRLPNITDRNIQRYEQEQMCGNVFIKSL